MTQKAFDIDIAAQGQAVQHDILIEQGATLLYTWNLLVPSVHPLWDELAVVSRVDLHIRQYINSPTTLKAWSSTDTPQRLTITGTGGERVIQLLVPYGELEDTTLLPPGSGGGSGGVQGRMFQPQTERIAGRGIWDLEATLGTGVRWRVAEGNARVSRQVTRQ